MVIRRFALIMGIVFLLVGLLGLFVPGLTTAPRAGDPHLAMGAGYGRLFGLFPVNLLHHLVHIGVGIWGIASYGSFSGARSFSRGLAVFYGVLALLGLFPLLNVTFGIIPIFGHDVWLHAFSAAAAAYFGYAYVERRAAVT